MVTLTFLLEKLSQLNLIKICQENIFWDWTWFNSNTLRALTVVLGVVLWKSTAVLLKVEASGNRGQIPESEQVTGEKLV